MIELLVFVAVVVLVILAVRLGRQDDTLSYHTSQSSPTPRRAGGLSDGLAFARQHAEQIGDTEAVQAIDNGTYKELLEHRAAARESKIAPGIDIYQYSIAGINYRKDIAAYLGRSTGSIKPEPTNRYDPNAIAVYAEDGHHLGYIPATDTYEVHSLRLRYPIHVSIEIEDCYDVDGRRFYVGEVSFQVKTKNKI